MRIAVLLLPAALFVAFSAAGAMAASESPGDSSVEASLDQDAVELGRIFTLHLSLTHDFGEIVQWPTTAELGPAFDEVSRRVRQRPAQGGLVTSDLFVQLKLFDNAVQEVPALSVLLESESEALHSSPLPLRVIGLVDLEKPQLRPLAGPVDVPTQRHGRLLAMGLLALGLPLLFFWMWRFMRRRTHTSEIATARHDVSPLDEALARLQQLESDGLLEEADLKPAYLEMSEILRSYLGRRFCFSSLDLTTREIASRLKETEQARAEWASSIVDWLSTSDLVKYAKSAASREDAKDALSTARQLLRGEQGTQQAGPPQDSRVEAAGA